MRNGMQGTRRFVSFPRIDTVQGWRSRGWLLARDRGSGELKKKGKSEMLPGMEKKVYRGDGNNSARVGDALVLDISRYL